MAKHKPHAKLTTTRCECERSDLNDLRLLALQYQLGSNPDAFREAVKALREKQKAPHLGTNQGGAQCSGLTEL